LNLRKKESKILISNQNANHKTLTLQECKKLISINGNSNTDEEILKIRDYLYQLAEIECRYFKEWQASDKRKYSETTKLMKDSENK